VKGALSREVRKNCLGYHQFDEFWRNQNLSLNKKKPKKTPIASFPFFFFSEEFSHRSSPKEIKKKKKKSQCSK
jgi:hypothetical protein